MNNDYGTVTVVSLDDAPLAESRKILIQCMTTEQFFGFKATGKASLSGQIEAVGAAPCGVERLDVSVTLSLEGRTPVQVVACDEHGYPRDTEVATSGTNAALRIELDPETVYHVLTR